MEATQRSKNTTLYTRAVPAQAGPRAAQPCSHKPPEAQQQHLTFQTFPEFVILLGNRCFLLLSSPFELNILVITGEIRVMALTKKNMNKCNKYSKKKEWK